MRDLYLIPILLYTFLLGYFLISKVDFFLGEKRYFVRKRKKKEKSMQRKAEDETDIVEKKDILC